MSCICSSVTSLTRLAEVPTVRLQKEDEQPESIPCPPSGVLRGLCFSLPNIAAVTIAKQELSEENADTTMKKLCLALLIAWVTLGCSSQANDTSALRQVQSIQLPGVEGR